jgi:HEPN domain-containing protein
MADRDPEHWLYRLSSEEWLRAAENELLRAAEALRGKQQRMGVAGARRAAGMAWNAVLARADDEAYRESYGRSYMEHLKGLARDASLPEAVRAAAEALMRAPLASPIVQLGPGDTRLADAARTILEHARRAVAPVATS